MNKKPVIGILAVPYIKNNKNKNTTENERISSRNDIFLSIKLLLNLSRIVKVIF